MRLIDADSIEIPHFHLATDRIKVIEAIDNAPTIEPNEIADIAYGIGICQGRAKYEPKRGRWLKTDYVDGDDQPMCRCSECGYLFNWTGWNFCPNCGADMREREGE